MGTKACDCQTVAREISHGKRIDMGVITRGVALALVVLSLARYLPDYVTGKFPAFSAVTAYIPSITVLLLTLITIVTARTMFIGTCCLPSFQVSPSALKQIIAERNVDAETRILSNAPELAKRLSRALQIETISYDDHDTKNKTDLNEFKRLHEYIENTYPLFHKHLEQTVINGHSLLYKWQGSDPSLRPYLLTAHMDVVPVPDAEKWTVPPFSGAITDDGYVWGRGAIDDKQNVFGYLEAITDLLESGFSPRRTVYVAFGHDEEVGGENGARHVATHLIETLGTDCMEFMMDEGLFVIDGAVPGHKKPVAMVCIAEKGAVTVRLSVDVTGGHASAPASETAIGILARAVARVEAHPMPPHADPAFDIFSSISEGFGGPLRAIMANLWLFGPLVKHILTWKPLTAVIVRTTTALTIFNAGTKYNVLPSAATAVINHRVHPRDSVARVVAWDKAVIADDRVRVEVLESIEPAPVSDKNHPAFADIATALHRTFKGSCNVAPGLFVANSDSKHYWTVTPQIFRFSPIVLTQSEISMFHGVNERIRVADYAKLVYFYRNLIELSDKREVRDEKAHRA